MNRLRVQLPMAAMFIVAAFVIRMTEEVPSLAADKNGYDFPAAGVEDVLGSGAFAITDVNSERSEELNIHQKFESEEKRMLSEIAMANVSNTLNVRSEPSEDGEKVGFLYKDCGGTILEQKDGWTKIKSGALTGWCSDEFLIFGDDAVSLAKDVGHYIVAVDPSTEAVRIRKEPSEEADISTIMSNTDMADFVEIIDDDWISVDYEGELGYISTEFVELDFHIDVGETIEQVTARKKIEEQLRKEAEEKAAKEAAAEAAKQAKKNRTQNRGAVAADADELRLLAALIYCEAGNQPYEGMVAVGAVVMNRVKSPAYPNTIYSVIYASGQFTPAKSGKVATVYNSGPNATVMQAAAAAINGETTVGGATHFRRNNGHAGIVIGAHVFW